MEKGKNVVSLEKAEKGDGTSTCILVRFSFAAVVRLSFQFNFYCASHNLQPLVNFHHDPSGFLY